MSDAIRIWRDGPHTMGAILGPNPSEGEVEFVNIEYPCGMAQQNAAGIEAARRLEKRLGIPARPIIFSTPEKGWPHLVDYRDARPDKDPPDPADWWKD